MGCGSSKKPERITISIDASNNDIEGILRENITKQQMINDGWTKKSDKSLANGIKKLKK